MHKQTLKNLLQYHREVQFKQFCSEIFPDFRLSESYGYLSGKFSLFQYRFMQFLSELDEAHLENFSDAILKRYGSDEPEFCDIMDSMQGTDRAETADESPGRSAAVAAASGAGIAGGGSVPV